MIDFYVGELAKLSPWILGLMLFVGTFILEDVAIVSGAMLAADDLIHPGAAFAVLLAGIACGDFVLYCLGLLIGRWPTFQKWQELERVLSVEKWLSANLFLTVMLVRFLPGFRLPCYLVSGWLRLPLLPFLSAVLVAGIIWTSLVFSSLIWMGSPLWQWLGLEQWVLLPVLLILIHLGQKLLKGRIQHYLENKK